jgi:hypothetical protein
MTSVVQTTLFSRLPAFSSGMTTRFRGEQDFARDMIAQA